MLALVIIACHHEMQLGKAILATEIDVESYMSFVSFLLEVLSFN